MYIVACCILKFYLEHCMICLEMKVQEHFRITPTLSKCKMQLIEWNIRWVCLTDSWIFWYHLVSQWVKIYSLEKPRWTLRTLTYGRWSFKEVQGKRVSIWFVALLCLLSYAPHLTVYGLFWKPSTGDYPYIMHHSTSRVFTGLQCNPSDN